MKLEDITQDTILYNYCDKLVSKGVVYYAYDAPRYGETDVARYRIYVAKMKLVIKTLNQKYAAT